MHISQEIKLLIPNYWLLGENWKHITFRLICIRALITWRKEL